ncbi:stage II sporulation protein E [Desulfotomaculum arcticum]|uniref:Stage II sporulation protein E n=1 Tax=Desulfotruncus arcticus DSM 17038 TaxID=1121424 RepID=A0A1I2WFF5_9FIRM|nr:stage II sporulation protein E [Desulfotomaculum arcticum] [Desulfotruncus arcticus DSM 17038]
MRAKGVDFLFERVEVNMFQRHQKSKEQTTFNDSRCEKGSRIKLLGIPEVKALALQAVILAAAFLLGRAVLLGEIFPFGAAFVAASSAYRRKIVLAALIGSTLGLATASYGWDLLVHFMSLLVAGVGVLALPAKAPRYRIMLGGIVFAAVVVIGTGYEAFTNPTTYEYVRVLFEAIFAAFFAAVYYTALAGLNRIVRGNQVSVDELLCLATLLISAVAGAGQVQWDGISLGGIMAGIVVMTAAFLGGSGFGAAAGAIMGVLPGLIFDVSPAALGAFAFAGFLGGLGGAMGKIGVAGGFLLGNILLTVYLNSGQDIAGVISECSAAAVIFLLAPSSLLNKIKKFFPMLNPWLEGPKPVEDCVLPDIKDRVSNWGSVFKEVSSVYEQVSGALEPEQDVRGWDPLINEIKNMVCLNCVLSRVCWEREQMLTYQKMQAFLDLVEQKGAVGQEELEENMRARCSRAGELVVAANCLYRMQKMNRFWESRLRESRKLVAEQLRGMQGVIDNLARSMDVEDHSCARRGEQMKQELKQAGLNVASLSMFPGVRDLEIEITLAACGGGKRCIYDVAPVLSSMTGLHLTPAIKDCTRFKRDDFCTIRFYPDLKLRLGLGVAASPRKGNTVSGDAYEFIQLGDGQLAIMMSDGMGSGPGAAAESRATLALLQQLLKAGFSHDLAVKILNSVMMCRLPEDNFTTVDLFLVDLYGKSAELIKIGASPSFFVHRGQVEVIRANSLPVGVVDEINTFSAEMDITAGDMLVMVTDGVLDVHPGENEKEDWISAVLGEIIELPPQEVAELILRLALSGAGEGSRAADDMTVIVVRAEKVK